MQTFKQFISEGGKAVSGVTTINLKNVPKTLSMVTRTMAKALRIPSESLRVVGSAGKKAVSGDLDMAIDITQVIKSKKVSTPADIQKEVLKAAAKIDRQAVKLPSFGVSFRAPISNTDGNQAGEFVQVDIFPTDDLDFQTFVKWSPRESESRYKAVHRNILLGMITKNANPKVLKRVDEVPLVWERLLLDFSRGLVKAVQSREGKKGILAKHKTISRTIITKDKQEIIDKLLGPAFTEKDANSFESLLAVVKSSQFPYKKAKDDILTDTAAAFINNGILLPSELKSYA